LLRRPQYYEVLGLPPNASVKEVKAKFRVLAKKWHPDRHPEHRKAEAEETFRRISEAYRGVVGPTGYAANISRPSRENADWFPSSPLHGGNPFHGEYGLSRLGLVGFIGSLIIIGSLLGSWPYYLARKNSMHVVRYGNRMTFVPDEFMEVVRTEQAPGAEPLNPGRAPPAEEDG